MIFCPDMSQRWVGAHDLQSVWPKGRLALVLRLKHKSMGVWGIVDDKHMIL